MRVSVVSHCIHSLRLLGLSMAIAITGCVSAEHSPQTEHAMSQALGVSSDVVFDVGVSSGDDSVSSGDHLTMAQAIERTLSTHPEVHSALARVRSAQADARQSRLLPNPILSVAIRFPEEGGKATVEAGLAADLISLLQRPGRVSAADARLRAASADAVSTALDVVRQVQESYVASQALDELMPVLESRRDLLDRLLKIARSRLRAGEGTQLDVTTIESQHVELKLEIAEIELQRREQRLSLAALLGQPGAAPQWELSPLGTSHSPLADEKEWIARALEHRPEIQALRWELSALGDELAAERLAALDGAEAGAEAERDDGDWSLGPSFAVPLPIFDFGQARRQKLRAVRIEAMHLLKQERTRVIEEVRRAHAAYESLSQTLAQARDRLIPLMRNQLDQAESQYLSGLTDVTALTLAEQQLQAAHGRRIELEQRTLESLVRLERAVGGAGVARRIAPSTAPSSAPRVKLQSSTSEQP